MPRVEAGVDRSPLQPRLSRGFCLRIFLEASQMKPQDDQEPLIPPDASISNPARAQPRLRGSLSSQQPLIARRRPPGNGDDGPPDGDGEPPPPPPPPVSVPDVAMQFSPCLPDAVRADVIRAIRDATGGTADVRALCQNQSERIGRSRRCSPAWRRSRMQRGRADLPRGYDSPRPQGGLFLPAPQCRDRRHFCGWILRY